MLETFLEMEHLWVNNLIFHLERGEILRGAIITEKCDVTCADVRAAMHRPRKPSFDDSAMLLVLAAFGIGNHTLIGYNIVVHGCIDGCSRAIMI